MFRIICLFVLTLSYFSECKINEDIKGGLKGPSFFSSYKARVVQLPSPTIEHIAPIQERLVLEEKTSHVVEHPKPRFFEQIRIEEGTKGVKKSHQDIVVEEHIHHHHENEEIRHQEEQRQQLKQIQQLQQLQQVEQIKQQLEQQKHLETVVEKQHVDNWDKTEHTHVLQGKTNERIEQIVQQKQERNEKLTEEEEAIAEPFPLIPKTSFTCDDKPILPGMYADLETGCRVYHFCFAKAQKAKIIEQVQQKETGDGVYVNSLILETQQPQPEQEQMKSFFCGEGTLFNQKLLICDHAVNVVCPESIHYYSANLEFGKPSAEPAAQIVQQKEVSKTNAKIIEHVSQQIVQHPEPVKIEQVKTAHLVIEEPIVQQQVKTAHLVVEQPIVQQQVKTAHLVVEQPIVQQQVKTAHLVVEQPVVQQVKTAHLVVEEPIVQQKQTAHLVVEEPIIQQKKECFGCKGTTSNKLVHVDSVVTTNSRSSNNWKEDKSWSTSQTVWGNKESSIKIKNEDLILRNPSFEVSGQLQEKPLNRRFLGEQMFSNIPETDFTCENKPFENGMYADIRTGCKIYHQCFNGRKSTFLCSRGTLFNQKVLSCDFEEKVKCSESEQYYTTNVEFN